MLAGCATAPPPPAQREPVAGAAQRRRVQVERWSRTPVTPVPVPPVRDRAVPAAKRRCIAPLPVNEEEQQALALLADLQRYAGDRRRSQARARRGEPGARRARAATPTAIRLAMLLTLAGRGSAGRRARAGAARLGRRKGAGRASPLKQIAAVLYAQIAERARASATSRRRRPPRRRSSTRCARSSAACCSSAAATRAAARGGGGGGRDRAIGRLTMAQHRRHPAGRRRPRPAEADQPAAHVGGLSRAHRRQRRDGARGARGRAARGRDHRPAHARHRRPAAVRGDPPPAPGAAGDHPHRARHDSRRGQRDAARRVRLPDQAVRQPGAAAEGGRRGAPRRRRAGADAPGERRLARRASSRAARAWRTCCGRRGWSPTPTPACSSSASRAPARSCSRARSIAPAARGDAAVRRGQLRRDPGAAARVRALRPRAGRVHRRRAGAQGPVPGRRRRHDLPGRDRRHAAGAAGEAAARAAGRRGAAGRRDAVDPGRRARRSRRRTAISTRSARRASSARISTTGSTSSR